MPRALILLIMALPLAGLLWSLRHIAWAGLTAAEEGNAAALRGVKSLVGAEAGLFARTEHFGFTNGDEGKSCAELSFNPDAVNLGGDQREDFICADSSSRTASERISLGNHVALIVYTGKNPGPTPWGGASFIAIAKHQAGDRCYAADSDVTTIYEGEGPACAIA